MAGCANDLYIKANTTYYPATCFHTPDGFAQTGFGRTLDTNTELEDSSKECA